MKHNPPRWLAGGGTVRLACRRMQQMPLGALGAGLWEHSRSTLQELLLAGGAQKSSLWQNRLSTCCESRSPVVLTTVIRRSRGATRAVQYASAHFKSRRRSVLRRRECPRLLGLGASSK